MGEGEGLMVGMPPHLVGCGESYCLVFVLDIPSLTRQS